MHKEIEKGFQEVGESNLVSTEVATLQIKRLKTIVEEYNKRTGSNVTTKKDKETYKSIEENGSEITKAEMINIIVAQNKTMSPQALRT